VIGLRTLAAIGLVALLPLPASGQQRPTITQRLRENQERLEEIRRERLRLQSDLSRLQGQAHTLSQELDNIDRQKSATSRIVNELDRQIGSLGSELDTVTIDLMLAQDALAEKRAVLETRLTEIYKRGSLWIFEVLLAAESFGDLLSRYKYLYLVSRQDRALTREIEELRDRVGQRRRELVTVHTEMGRQRGDRVQELSRYVSLEQRRQLALRSTQAARQEASDRLSALARAEQELNNLIATLERERARGPATASTITDDARGRLDWPADGRVIYRFGREAGPDNTTLTRRGIGIAVPPGTPVRAVARGTVDRTGPYGTYGLLVILNHGGGYYTVYLYLSSVAVTADQAVEAGQVIGLSGGAATEEGPHIEFQIRGEGAIALDPQNWLKRK